MLHPGTKIGHYQVVSSLGAGGMGEVYRAEDTRLHRTVAIKILSPQVATPDRVARFEQEARAASALNHPNILTIHDVGREGDTSYFAMEWVDGQTLRELLRAGPIALRRAIHLAEQIAEGLARAHAAGIVHRDLKPENVMVTADGLVKIVDFGLAKLGPDLEFVARGDGERQIQDLTPTVTRAGGTEPGIVLGTIGYMSPEQACGRPVDHRADQFALGLLIYEMVTRTRPFQRATTAQSLAATIEDEPAPIDALNPDVPPHLEAIVTRLLAKDPTERYDSTRDLARELKSVLENLSRRSGPQSASDHPSRATSATMTTDVSRRGTRRYVLLAAAVVFFAAVAGAVWMWRPVAEPPSTETDRPLLAVRPFRSLSADPQQGYFAAGITDEIRGQLSQVSSLRLLSRNGLDGYSEDLPRAVRELGVRSVVDGSVRVEGSLVRVSAELVDASTRETLWAQQYDRELSDILAVQSDIAQQIARALRANLSPSEQERLDKRPTDNHEAYSLYLRAREMDHSNRAENLAAIELLRTAVAFDPKFALAQAHIAYRLMFMAYYDAASYLDQGIAEAEIAKDIDPTLPYTYFALGSGYARKGNGAKSRQAFLRALELDPNAGGAMANFSIAEIHSGRLDEATYWGRRHFLLTGRRGPNFYHLVVPILNIRADAESRVLLEEAARRPPASARNELMLSLLELYEGHGDRAIVRADALVAAHSQNEEVKLFRADLALLLDAEDLERWLTPLMEQSASNRGWMPTTVRMRYAYVLSRKGEASRARALATEAERIAREEIEARNDSAGLRVELAAGAALQDDSSGALEWLERAFEAGYRDYEFVARAPFFRPRVASTPQFTELVDRMRRDVAAQRERARERGLLEIASLLAPAK